MTFAGKTDAGTRTRMRSAQVRFLSNSFSRSCLTRVSMNAVVSKSTRRRVSVFQSSVPTFSLVFLNLGISVLTTANRSGKTACSRMNDMGLTSSMPGMIFRLAKIKSRYTLLNASRTMGSALSMRSDGLTCVSHICTLMMKLSRVYFLLRNVCCSVKLYPGLVFMSSSDSSSLTPYLIFSSTVPVALGSYTTKPAFKLLCRTTSLSRLTGGYFSKNWPAVWYSILFGKIARLVTVERRRRRVGGRVKSPGSRALQLVQHKKTNAPLVHAQDMQPVLMSSFTSTS